MILRVAVGLVAGAGAGFGYHLLMKAIGSS